VSDLWKFAAPIALVLTVATWLFFAYSSTTTDHLNAAQTTVVFAFWFVVTLSMRWVWRYVFKKSSGGSSHDIPKP